LTDLPKIWSVCLSYDHTNAPFVDLQKFKMAAILDVKMAANMAANSTTIP
jgi:hypothetical protein